MSSQTPRRAVLMTGAAFCLTAALPARAEDALEIEWRDLVPSGQGTTMQRLRELGVVQHGELNTPFDQEKHAEITQEFDGKLVRIPGYMVPLDYTAEGVTDFLLVPYIGACIHVPPPPPNQLVFVTADRPYDVRGLFEAVYVTGIFGSAATATQLADVGYSMVSADVTPYT